MNIPIVQNGKQFLADLEHGIANAQKRIWIQVMIFEIHPLMDRYIALLGNAAKRGVDVRIITDWISERYYGEDLDTLPTLSPERRKKRNEVHLLAEQMCAKLRQSGVQVVIDKIPSRFGKHILIGNRNHNKLFIVDDIAWTGGVNLIASPDNFIDFMVKLYNPKIVTVFENYFLHKPKNDMWIDCTQDYRFLIDSGHKWKSLIYDEAIDLIRSADKEITLVSQLLPDNNFLTILLKKSWEGVHVTILISHKDHNIFTRFPFRIHLDGFLAKIKNNPNITIIHADRKIHAKLLVVDNKRAIFGSHNFAKWNELIGIEETGFLTADKELIKQFNDFWKKIVK